MASRRQRHSGTSTRTTAVSYLCFPRGLQTLCDTSQRQPLVTTSTLPRKKEEEKKKNVSNALFEVTPPFLLSMCVPPQPMNVPIKLNDPQANNNKQVTDSHARGCPVAEWDAEGEGSTVAKTFSLFLERFRNELLSGRCEYVEGLGVVEKMSTSPPRGK